MTGCLVEKKSADDVVPETDGWVMIDTDNHEKGESGEWHDDAVSKVGMESRYGGVGCRDSTPGAAAEFGAYTRPTVMCVFMAKQVTRDGLGEKQEETDCGRGGQASYSFKDWLLEARGICKRGDKCRINFLRASPDIPNLLPVCRDSLNGECAKSRRDYRYQHVSEDSEEKAEMRKNRGWNH